MTRSLMLWAFVVAALALTVWGVLTWVSPSTQCRGADMGPGDVCTYSSYTNISTEKTQTYEQRIATARQSGPVVIVVGLLATAFGIVLIVRTGSSPPSGQTQASSDIGP